MTNVYLDTNFFIYLSDKSSVFYSECVQLLKYCEENQIIVITSSETIQEIIHLAINTKRLPEGLKIAHKALQISDSLLPINKNTIEIYLKKASIYRNIQSRDLIHLAVCLENKIDRIITFDQGFRKFKEIKTLTPAQFLKN